MTGFHQWLLVIALGQATRTSKREAISGSLLFGEPFNMETLNGAGLGARRNEDIALDLLKFVAGTTGVGRTAAGSTGFSGASAPKPEEHVTQLLELYSRCLKSVQGEKEA
jgi:hypothetical protein